MLVAGFEPTQWPVLKLRNNHQPCDFRSIECAKLGERNPIRLREIVIKSLQG
jgi:hypothetical protein